jgi:hypothetical protein
MNPDFKDLFAESNAHGVEYPVGGAHVLAVHGYLRERRISTSGCAPTRRTPSEVEGLGRLWGVDPGIDGGRSGGARSHLLDRCITGSYRHHHIHRGCRIRCGMAGPRLNEVCRPAGERTLKAALDPEQARHWPNARPRGSREARGHREGGSIGTLRDSALTPGK